MRANLSVPVSEVEATPFLMESRICLMFVQRLSVAEEMLSGIWKVCQVGPAKSMAVRVLALVAS
ncbi:MAG: hypothetical protein A2506_03800 [Elusimicrobia bacterium RIFOXYD12_FULL_66_9]|nr:MAG: hypothetical protein A2506_03800 [Elusimicrobia bacterium RIFOXYD12_FULL_66_9]